MLLLTVCLEYLPFFLSSCNARADGGGILRIFQNIFHVNIPKYIYIFVNIPEYSRTNAE